MGINEYINIGNAIKELRKSKGITAKKAAEDLKIKYSTYSNYENGNREPNLETLRSIADYYNVTINDMIGFDNGLKLFIKELKERSVESEELTHEDQALLAQIEEDYLEYQEAVLQLQKLRVESVPIISKIISFCKLLNEDGMKRILEYAEMLTNMTEFRNDK